MIFKSLIRNVYYFFTTENVARGSGSVFLCHGPGLQSNITTMDFRVAQYPMEPTIAFVACQGLILAKLIV